MNLSPVETKILHAACTFCRLRHVMYMSCRMSEKDWRRKDRVQQEDWKLPMQVGLEPSRPHLFHFRSQDGVFHTAWAAPQPEFARSEHMKNNTTLND